MEWTKWSKRTTLAMALALAFGAPALAAEPVAKSAATPAATKKPFLWENATVYFLLTDRFNNAFTGNDLAYGRNADAAPLRGYMAVSYTHLTLPTIYSV